MCACMQCGVFICLRAWERGKERERACVCLCLPACVSLFIFLVPSKVVHTRENSFSECVNEAKHLVLSCKNVLCPGVP